MIFLQFIGFYLNKHSIDICNINTHTGEKCSSGAQISYGGCPNLSLILCVLPKTYGENIRSVSFLSYDTFFHANWHF